MEISDSIVMLKDANSAYSGAENAKTVPMDFPAEITSFDTCKRIFLNLSEQRGTTNDCDEDLMMGEY